MANPPGPSSPVFMQMWRWGREPFPFLDEMHARFGDVFTMNLGVMPNFVILSNPEHIREVFADAGEKLHAGKIGAVLGPFLGARSILTLDGAEHMRLRKLMLPAFHGERMHAYGRTMMEITHDAVDRFALNAQFAIHEPLQWITLQVICRTIFGIDEATLRQRLTGRMNETLDLAAWPPLLIPALQRDLGPLSPWGRFTHLASQIDQILLGEIRKRRAENATGRTDVLSLLVNARDEQGEPMNDEELRDQLITLLVAGHETTATALAWSVRWLLAEPAVHARLLSELRAAGELTPDKVAKMEYLDGFVRETLRMQPVIPLVGRVIQQPMTLAGYALSPGTAIAPSVYLAHQRPSVFPEPKKFKPERWIGARIASSEWFPFGGGIRRCIGMAFSIYEMKMVLAAMLPRLSMHQAPGYVPKMMRRSITLSPSEGMPVVVTERRDAARAQHAVQRDALA